MTALESTCRYGRRGISHSSKTVSSVVMEEVPFRFMGQFR